MSLFLLCVLALVCLALLLVLPVLLRRKALAQTDAAPVDARGANLLVLREQLAALDAEHAAGLLDLEQHRLARIEIERRALEEDQAGVSPAVAARAGKTAVALGLFIPLFVVVVYGLLGNPQAMLPPTEDAASAPAGEVSRAQVEAMVEKLAQRLESQTTPQAGDLQAWSMLARSFSVLQRYPEASRAYSRARALSPDDAQLLADHADVLAMLQGQSVQGEPVRLIERALRLDPKNLKALALAGSAAFERKDFAAALTYWGQAQQLAPAGSAFAVGLESSLQQARAAVPGGAQTSGVVRLASALADKVAPNDTVFIFARAAVGPRMPLAILKRKASELPITFTMDDSSAMAPELKLSKFPSVVIGARISRSGDAMPRSGDLVGQIGPVDSGSAKLVLVIDGVQP